VIKPQRQGPRALTDHPELLGRLAEVFVRRRIAMAADGAGQLVLVRPDSGVIDAGDTAAAFKRTLALIEQAALGDEVLVRLPASGERPTSGVLRFDIPGVGISDERGEPRYGVARLNEVLERLRGAGLVVEPNHVLLASQGITGNPVGAEAHFAGGMMFTAELREVGGQVFLHSTSAPTPEPPPFAERLDIRGRKRPQVLVLDTGLRTADADGDGQADGAAVEHPRLQGIVRVHADWKSDPTVEAIDDEDEPDDDNGGFLDFEGGHGTFICGIIRQICPDADVVTAGVLSSFGDGDVATVTAAYERISKVAGPFDIVVMSFGGFMAEDDGALFGRALHRLIGHGLGVSAAGNQATSRRYFPAALPDVVGVGALGEDGRAWFSNFGGWVDACAPGIDVVSTFFTSYQESPYRQEEPPIDDPGRAYAGYARWSGTSFSAPKVAGVIAQEMYVTGSAARDVWARLSNHQRYRYPDLGTVFNV
jgi:subtilisin family serine protease